MTEPTTLAAFGGNEQRATVFMDRYAMKDEFGNPLEFHPDEMFSRVARAIGDNPAEQLRFYQLMDGFKFVPGGRILAGAGTGTEVTFYNCYVIPIETEEKRAARSLPSFVVKHQQPGLSTQLLEDWKKRPLILEGDAEVELTRLPVDTFGNDSREAIIDTIGMMVDILSHGGGVGINWSTLRPQGTHLKRLNGTAGGPIGWMEVASAAVMEVEQGGSRRGAAMFMLDDWHPDLLNFINVKRDLSKIKGANLSIAVSDAFMTAVKNDEDWHTMFPDTTHPSYNAEWDGDMGKWLAKYGLPATKVHSTHKARDLWRQIAEMAWDNGEPGLVFLDRYNKLSTAGEVERLISVNPCGEQGLGPYSVCNLGSMNLSAYVKDFSAAEDWVDFDWQSFERDVESAVRFLDNAIDKNFYFLPENERAQKDLRRIGLGVMGLADALIKLELRYGSPKAVVFTEQVFQTMKDVAITTSAELALEKGPAPAWRDNMWERPYLADYVERGGAAIRGNARPPLRNLFLLTQAPTGTTSLLAGVSSGIEPWFDFEYQREDRTGKHWVKVPVYAEFLAAHPELEGKLKSESLPDYFVNSNDVSIEEHIAMQAGAQKYNDSSISKTVNAPKSHTVEDVEKLYMLAYDSGLKGIAYFRDGCGRAQVLSRGTDKEEVDERDDIIEQLNAEVNGLQEQLKVAKGQGPRPDRLSGVTKKVRTKAGTAYVTVNRTEDGKPFEVFVNVGKAGTDVMEMGEAMGRLLSLAVQRGASLSELGSQLSGVGGYGKFQKALPSAIGEALLGEDMVSGPDFGREVTMTMEFKAGDLLLEWANKPVAQASGPVYTHTFTPAEEKATNSGTLCGECSNYTVIRAEGCMKCQNCGWSAC